MMHVEFRSERRGYMLTMERDLFGAFILLRRWYGLHNRRGGVKQQVFEDQEEAMLEWGRVQRLRERRGYRVVTS